MPLKTQVTSAKFTFPSKKHAEGNMHQKENEKKKKFDDAINQVKEIKKKIEREKHQNIEVLNQKVKWAKQTPTQMDFSNQITMRINVRNSQR